jgi:starch phosphorylase
LGWDKAWELTKKALAYTNHTLLPEALEKWPAAWFEILLPRHLEIIYEINRRLLHEVRVRFPGDEGRVERVSLVEEGRERKIRMANLAIVGTHSTNGVAAVHSKLLRTMTVKDLAEMFPERFSNKTNGVTPRRWLLEANPALSGAITQVIGERWITDLSQLNELKPFPRTSTFAKCSSPQSERPKRSSPNGSKRRRGRSSIRTRSSIARSSVSTNTKGSC